jgi:hypothetical protein
MFPFDSRLDFLNFHQMVDLGDHTPNLRCVVVNHALVHSPDPQSTDGQLLLFKAANGASFLRDPQFSSHKKTYFRAQFQQSLDYSTLF